MIDRVAPNLTAISVIDYHVLASSATRYATKLLQKRADRTYLVPKLEELCFRYQATTSLNNEELSSSSIQIGRSLLDLARRRYLKRLIMPSANLSPEIKEKLTECAGQLEVCVWLVSRIIYH